MSTIKKKVSAASKRKLLSTAKAHDKKAADKEASLIVRQGKQIQRLFATENAAMAAILKNNQKIKVLQDSLQAAQKLHNSKVQAGVGDKRKLSRARNQFAKSLREIYAAADPALSKAYRRVIDDDQINRKLLSLMDNHFVLKRGKYGSSVFRAFHAEDDDGTINPTGRPDETPPSFVLTAPYDDGGKHRSGALVHAISANFDTAAGTANQSCFSGTAGGGGARALVGSFVTIPPGFTKLRINAKIRCSYSTIAYSFLSVHYAGTDAIVELLGTDNSVLTLSQGISWSLAPIAWFQEGNGNDIFFVNGTFDIPNTGGEFMIRGGVRGLVWAGGWLGGAISNNSSNVEEIRVEAE